LVKKKKKKKKERSRVHSHVDAAHLPPESTMARRVRICALGSSFAAGPGIRSYVAGAPRNAGRSTLNYAHLLAERLDADLIDVTASGATLLNIIDSPQTLPFRIFSKPVPPQLDALPSDVDVVTITAGGNDVGYSAGMVFDSIRASLLGPPEDSVVAARSGTPNGTTVDEVMNRLVDIIDRVKKRAPGATVYLVQYINVFGSNTRPRQGTPLSQAQIEYHRKQGDHLARAFSLAAEARPGTKLVDVRTLSNGHEVGSEKAWVSGFSWLGMFFNRVVPYHPNAEGHKAVAEELYPLVSTRLGAPG
jgi:lysophospholipase L1-like esterase